MKDCQKRWKPGRRNSVIVALMGLDKLHPKQPFHEKRRGLSESYVRNAASIALRPGSLVPGRCRTDNEGEQSSSSKAVNACDRFVKSRTCSSTKGIRSLKTAGAPVSRSLFGVIYDSRESKNKQKLQHALLHSGESDIDSMGKSLNPHSEMIDDPRRCFSASTSNFEPKSEKLEYDLNDDETDAHLNPGYREQHGCVACSRAMNRISRQESCRSKFEEVLRYRSYSHEPSLASQSKKQNLKKYKMAKEAQGFGVSGRDQTLNEILSLVSRISKRSNFDMKPGLCDPTSLQTRSSDSRSIDVGDDESPKGLPVSEFETVKGADSTLTGWNSIQDEPFEKENESKEQTTFKNEDVGYISGPGNEKLQISPGVEETMSPGSRVSELSVGSFSCFDSALSNPEAYILGNRDEMDSSFENDCGKDDELSGNHLGIILEEGGKSSAVEEVINHEASLNEYFEEESLTNLKRTNQHSPDSVLGSFGVKSSHECFDSAGLMLQLESLNFDSRETCSKGSVMVISGDEDAEEEFGILYEDSRKVTRWLGDGQNRNFSYTVDVLDEAGFCGTNSYMDFKMWHSLECPISPSVFEALEKKYGKQTSWHRSERQLLFDRINSLLLEIFNPIRNFHSGTTPIHRRVSDSFRLDGVIDKLWTKLINQENQKSREPSLDKWSEMEEGIDIICGELEASLFDELVAEFTGSSD